MSGKRYYQRIAAELGLPQPSTSAPMVAVAIYHNIVEEYRSVEDPGTKAWCKEVRRLGGCTAEITEEHAKRLIGKRFQEQSYYHTEPMD
jgi:hypothetical protein